MNLEQIRINYLSQINLLITECRKINEACPKGVTKENYPNWNNKQIINYWWSGDINDSPNDLKPSSKIHSTLTAHSTQLLTHQGRETRQNPSGLRSYLAKTFKK